MPTESTTQKIAKAIVAALTFMTPVMIWAVTVERRLTATEQVSIHVEKGTEDLRSMIRDEIKGLREEIRALRDEIQRGRR